MPRCAGASATLTSRACGSADRTLQRAPGRRHRISWTSHCARVGPGTRYPVRPAGARNGIGPESTPEAKRPGGETGDSFPAPASNRAVELAGRGPWASGPGRAADGARTSKASAGGGTRYPKGPEKAWARSHPSREAASASTTCERGDSLPRRGRRGPEPRSGSEPRSGERAQE